MVPLSLSKQFFFRKLGPRTDRDIDKRRKGFGSLLAHQPAHARAEPASLLTKIRSALLELGPEHPGFEYVLLKTSADSILGVGHVDQPIDDA